MNNNFISYPYAIGQELGTFDIHFRTWKEVMSAHCPLPKTASVLARISF